jgi:hypothetical protein
MGLTFLSSGFSLMGTHGGTYVLTYIKELYNCITLHVCGSRLHTWKLLFWGDVTLYTFVVYQRFGSYVLPPSSGSKSKLRKKASNTAVKTSCLMFSYLSLWQLRNDGTMKIRVENKTIWSPQQENHYLLQTLISIERHDRAVSIPTLYCRDPGFICRSVHRLTSWCPQFLSANARIIPHTRPLLASVSFQIQHWPIALSFESHQCDLPRVAVWKP